MCPVVHLSAQHTHNGLILLTEQLQQPLVLLTHTVLKVLHRFDQLVFGEAGSVRLQMLLTVRR